MANLQSQTSEKFKQLLQYGVNHARAVAVDYINNAFSPNQNTDNNAKQTENNQMNLISNFESLLVELQSLLIWEKPYNSALSLLFFTCFYWLVIFWSPRLFTIIALMFFFYHFYEMWTRFLWPEIKVPSTEVKENWTTVNPKVLSAPEFQQFLSKLKSFIVDIFQGIIEFRRKSHGTFCCYSIAFFIILFFIGKTIPGVILFYCLALSLFLTPGMLLHVIPSHVLESIQSFFDNTQTESQLSTKESKQSHISSDNRNSSESSVEDTSSSSQINKNFYDDFFENDPTKNGSADDTDDFEMISESDIIS